MSGIRLRSVKLLGGAHNGREVTTQEDWAWVEGDLYVWGGKSRNEFVHAGQVLLMESARQRYQERHAMTVWLKRMKPTRVDSNRISMQVVEPPALPKWKAIAWTQLITRGAVLP